MALKSRTLGLILVAAFSLVARAQSDIPQPRDEPSAPMVGVIPSPHVQEVPVAGLQRTNADTIAYTLPDSPPVSAVRPRTTLLLHDFDFEGVPISTDKLHLRRLSAEAVEITSLAYTTGAWRVHLADAASCFGLGEHADTLDHAHTVIRNLSQNLPHATGSSTARPMPFFLSTTGYGLWVDTTAEATFDLNATSPSDIILDVTGPRLRLVLFTGPSFPRILAAFTALVGRSQPPPAWAFAPWTILDRQPDQARVQAQADLMRQLALPTSVLLLDAPWAPASTSYKLSPKQFPDPAALAKYVHDLGFKLILSPVSPIVLTTSPGQLPGQPTSAIADPYIEAAANGFFVKQHDGTPLLARSSRGQGALVDFTNPAARRWWQDQLRPALATGADGFEQQDPDLTLAPDVRFADTTDPRVMRNRYAVLAHDAIDDLLQKDLKGNGILLANSTTQGATGPAFLLSRGDEASSSRDGGLAATLTAGLGAGLSGMPLWTASLTNPPAASPLLLLRWIELAALSPILQIPSLPASAEQDQLPGGLRTLDILRKYAVLHMSLFPYRYAAAQEAARTGMPILRALVLQFQDDPRARAARDEYLFGPDLLVAPVLDENTRRPVYLPPGRWVDFWTGTSLPGGQTILAEAPPDLIPLYARAGAVLPRIPDDIMTLVPLPAGAPPQTAAQPKALDTRRVYEIIDGASAEPATLLDFEGRTLTRGAGTLTLAGDLPAHVILRWRFRPPSRLTVNGRAATLQAGNSIEFDHLKQSRVDWH